LNHSVHSKTSEHMKHSETTLRWKLDDMDVANGKLEAELCNMTGSVH